MNNSMNLLLSSDNNYAQHLGVAIYSVLFNNAEIESIRFFVVDNGIKEDNIKKLRQVIEPFKNAELSFISFEKWKNRLNLSMEWPISLSSYARLFMGSMLPEDVDRVLYLDCDMVVCGSLQPLWMTDMRGHVLGAVQDYQGDITKQKIGLGVGDSYFNAGMLLIDLYLWRQMHMEDLCLHFIDAHKGNVFHHDQGTLNGVFQNSWYRLPVKYNLMTLAFLVKPQKLSLFCKDSSPSLYDVEEIERALKDPVILHFTPSLTSRPWVATCIHPLRHMYWDYLARTPWNDAVEEKDSSRWYVRLINSWLILKNKHF